MVVRLQVSTRGVMAAAAVLLAAVAGQAQEAPGAVGRISYGEAPAVGAAICTGVLVAPDLVLTAGHCVRGAQDAPATVRFAAGFADGRSLALRRGAEVILSGGGGGKERVAEDGAGEESVAAGLVHDVALLRLDAPVAADLVLALPLAAPAPPRGPADLQAPDRFSLIAYRRDAPGLPQRRDDCTLLATEPGLLALSCPVVSGNSGAPLLAWDGTRWRVAAVMVAASSGSAVQSFATLIPPDLRARIARAVQP